MKRKNNEGSIFYNSSRNRWNAQYKIKEDGKIKTKSFKNKEDAEDFIDIIMYERNAKNGDIAPRKVNSKLVSILKDLDINGISTYSLRYTFATRCAESEIKDVVLKDIMGHYDIEITKNIYIDIQENYEQEEIKKVEKYIKKVGIMGK